MLLVTKSLMKYDTILNETCKNVQYFLNDRRSDCTEICEALCKLWTHRWVCSWAKKWWSQATCHHCEPCWCWYVCCDRMKLEWLQRFRSDYFAEGLHCPWANVKEFCTTQYFFLVLCVWPGKPYSMGTKCPTKITISEKPCLTCFGPHKKKFSLMGRFRSRVRVRW